LFNFFLVAPQIWPAIFEPKNCSGGVWWKALDTRNPCDLPVAAEDLLGFVAVAHGALVEAVGNIAIRNDLASF